MIHKNNTFLMLLFFLFPATTNCMETAVVKKKSIPLKSFRSLYTTKLKYECDALKIKNELYERHYGYLVRGWSPAATTFFYYLYTAKSHNDCNNALMNRGELYIKLYCTEQIEGSTALGITTMAKSVPFSEKKEFIQTLLLHGFSPTAKDKELAFLEKWERASDKMILLHYTSRKNSKSSLYKLRSKFIIKIFSFLVDLEELLF
jgi:hypothetical protein